MNRCFVLNRDKYSCRPDWVAFVPFINDSTVCSAPLLWLPVCAAWSWTSFWTVSGLLDSAVTRLFSLLCVIFEMPFLKRPPQSHCSMQPTQQCPNDYNNLFVSLYLHLMPYYSYNQSLLHQPIVCPADFTFQGKFYIWLLQITDTEDIFAKK